MASSKKRKVRRVRSPLGFFSGKEGTGLAEKRTRPASSFEQLSAERMHELAVMGGKAAAAARKRRKGLREALLRLMEEDGVQERLAEALVREATECSRPGSAVKAFEVIRDTIGEKPGKQEKPEWNPKCVDLSALSVEELLELLR